MTNDTNRTLSQWELVAINLAVWGGLGMAVGLVRWLIGA